MRNRKLQQRREGNTLKHALSLVSVCEQQLSRMSLYYLEALSHQEAPLFGGLTPEDFWYSCLAMVAGDVALIKKKLENLTDNTDIVFCKDELNDRYQFLVDLEGLYAGHKKPFYLKTALIYSIILVAAIMAFVAITIPLEIVGSGVMFDSVLLGVAYLVIIDKVKDAAVTFNKGLSALDQKHPVFKKYIHRAIYSKHYKLEGDFHQLSVGVLERIFEKVLSQYRSKIQTSRDQTATNGRKSWVFTYNPREVSDEDFLLVTKQISADIDAAAQSRALVGSKKSSPLPMQDFPSSFMMEQVLPRHRKKQKAKSSENIVAESSSPVASSSADSSDVIFPEGYVHNSSPDCLVKPVVGNNHSALCYFVWSLPPNSLLPEEEKKFHEKAGQIAKAEKGSQGVKFLSAKYIANMGSQGVPELSRFQPGDARVKMIGSTVGNIGVFGRTLTSTNKPNCRLIVFDTVINKTHGSKR